MRKNQDRAMRFSKRQLRKRAWLQQADTTMYLGDGVKKWIKQYEANGNKSTDDEETES